MKIATTTADFIWYTAPWDISSALLLMADAGFKYVDISLGTAMKPNSPMCGDGWETWADDIGNTAARLGLTFVQAHSSDTVYDKGEKRDYLTSMIERQLLICEKLGVPGIVVHGIPKPQGEREDFMVKNTEFYRDLLKTSEKTGVMIYTENTCRQNCPTYYIFNGDDANELCSRVNHELFGVCWDTGHAHVHGTEQYSSIITMGKNLKALHIHDNYGVADVHIQPYAGNLCFDAVLKGLVDAKYTGPFTLEAYCAPVPANFCFCNRKPFVKDGVVYDKALMPPISIMLRSERLMLDTARFMLEAYGCYED
ncbi:MAG: sugar phosphate isomerase/epimerase [Clostridiales bacterium]|nr:sugar phosphate isomerase/epimerase [Clostridiales bacterium]